MDHAEKLAYQYVNIKSVEQLKAILLEFHELNFEGKNKFLNYVLGYVHGLRDQISPDNI